MKTSLSPVAGARDCAPELTEIDNGPERVVCLEGGQIHKALAPSTTVTMSHFLVGKRRRTPSVNPQ